MAPIAIVFGALLSVLGVALYIYTAMASVTALIPAFFGVPLILLGVLASYEKYRMHGMHGAALLGLIGFAVPLGRVIVASTRDGFAFGPGIVGSITMSALCLIFVGLCVKSFIDARVARKQKEAAAKTPQAPSSPAGL